PTDSSFAAHGRKANGCGSSYIFRLIVQVQDDEVPAIAHKGQLPAIGRQYHRTLIRIARCKPRFLLGFEIVLAYIVITRLAGNVVKLIAVFSPYRRRFRTGSITNAYRLSSIAGTGYK